MLTDGQEPEIPQYYVVSRSLADFYGAQQALQLTPARVVIVDCNEWDDYERAQSLGEQVVIACPGKTASEMAPLISESIGAPVLMLGDVDFVEAVYADGRRVSLAAQA